MKNLLLVGVGLLAFSSLAEPLEWKFPLDSSCHEGMAFGDAVTGVLVWGGGDTLNFTVGRSDLWDHRGGYKWTDEQSYSNIVSIVRADDKERMLSLFKKETPKGEPRNPTILPLGRIVVKMPGAELKRGTLDPFTGQASLFLADGREIRLAMCRGWGEGMFAIKFPEGLERDISFVHSMEFPNVAKRLVPLGFKPAEKKFVGSEQVGFTWELPADDPVSLGTWCNGKDELCFRTARSRECGIVDWSGPAPNYENISRESEGWWRNFWKTAARVTIPDRALQEAYDYGMYRFASMTGEEGVPAGLQGPWIEDDGIPPWSGDYHFNINVQECYSPAFRGGHPEHLKPLFAMIKRWHPTLRENARKFCGIEDGFVLPHSVDDRGTNIGGFWTGTIDHGSAAWVANMMFKYFTYSRDVEFLKTDAYPFMKGVMNVYRAMMEETADGKLAIPVGPSPEFGASDFHKAIRALLKDGQRTKDGTHKPDVDPAKGGEPRTALGLTPDRKTLVILAVDGRQPGYSEGASFADVADIMLMEGCSDAVNMDGGGSTSFVVWDRENACPKMLNRHANGYRRRVAVNLGITFSE